MRRKKIAIVEQLRGTVENEEEMETQNQGWSQFGRKRRVLFLRLIRARRINTCALSTIQKLKTVHHNASLHSKVHVNTDHLLLYSLAHADKSYG